MTDETLEQELRKLPTPELPTAWRTEILSAAAREARISSRSRQVWPPLFGYLQNLFLRHPVTAGAMAALWMLIFVLKAGTPVDPSEKRLLAHIDPNRPIHFLSISDEILLAHLEEDESEERSIRQIP